ncbi:MAG: type 4a pilus biogenesis protein PilO [Gammaproteobacteria bacterium]|jgi:type IV pilus assembly protein PilO|nr:type 4a pilus biogenesis protein PilO [Gammaproteobacteria bacterium]MCW8942140.1 type 4a pilus biogenesis protein PilO [Gammaproteobacteria bacterium]
MDLSEINLSDLDVEDLKKIGTAPLPVKIAIVVVLCIGLAVAGYFLHTTKQKAELDKVIAEEQQLRNIFSGKQAKAANLEAYKQQLEEMRTSFGTLLRQLPNETEIETLLTDISQTGISSGLEIDYFKPEGLRPKEFYSEYPIKLKVTGNYHEFAEFISGVAALPRIVTVQNIAIKPSDSKDSVKLTMELTAITYQYLDESAEVAE